MEMTTWQCDGCKDDDNQPYGCRLNVPKSVIPKSCPFGGNDIANINWYEVKVETVEKVTKV